MCVGLAFINEHFFERKGHLKVILKLQTEMSYIKNFLNVVYIFSKALCEIVCTFISLFIHDFWC